MKANSSKVLCLFALFFFALLSAWRDLHVKTMYSSPQMSPILVTWLSSTITWLVFYCLTSVANRTPYVFQDVRCLSSTGKLELLLNNLGTLTAFLTAFWAIKLLDPYSISLVDYGASPVLTAMLAYSMRNETLSGYSLLGLAISVIGIAVLVIAITGRQEPVAITRSYFIGIGLALISAVAFAANQVWNKNLVEKGIIRQRLLISRLPLLILALSPFAIPDLHTIKFDIWELIGWSLLGMAFPLYLLMYAFERLQVKNVAYALFLVPVFIFIGSVMDGFIKVDLLKYSLAGILVLGGIALGEWNPRPKIKPVSH